MNTRSGHIMRVTFDNCTVRLVPECHEPGGAICRVECAAGCESYSYPEHEHALKSTATCNAVDYLVNGEMVDEMCESDGPFLIYDGIPIGVTWDGDVYRWYPVHPLAERTD